MRQKISTGDTRNEKPLTQEQIQCAITFAITLGMPANRIAYSDHYWTGYNDSADILLLGTDLYPKINAHKGTKTANSRVSWRGVMGHELIGHREAAQKGWTQSEERLEETQASIRAARFTPLLDETERIILLRDAISRVPANIRIREIKGRLHITER